MGRYRAEVLTLVGLLLLPLVELGLPPPLRFASELRPILIFTILGLGLNIVTGFCGLLHLGIAAFMAIGAYCYAILSSEIYPFQLGFWLSACAAALSSGFFGVLLGLPTLRLRGDYVAIVTLGFGEIVQDTLKNLEIITKGTQGINPLPPPTFFGVSFAPQYPLAWYYLLIAATVVVVALNYRLLNSRIGRAFIALREDELAARCSGVHAVHMKLLAFCLGASVAGLAGALWASFLGSTGDPGNYDFQLSIIALCIVIIGGLGSIRGVFVGAGIMIGFSSILLSKVGALVSTLGVSQSSSVLMQPNNWKYLIFGSALVVMMRWKPEGLIPSRTLRSEFYERSKEDE